MRERFSYRGHAIRIEDDGTFAAEVEGEPFKAPSLAAIKTQIKKRLDAGRRVSIDCWVLLLWERPDAYDSRLDEDERTPLFRVEVKRVEYRGHNMVTFAPRFFEGDEEVDLGSGRYDRPSYTLAVPATSDEPPEEFLALKRLAVAAETELRKLGRALIEAHGLDLGSGVWNRATTQAAERRAIERLGGEEAS